MHRHTGTFLALTACVVVGIGCFDSAAPSNVVPFRDPLSTCAPGVVAIDLTGDHFADRCEVVSCETLAPVDCGGAIPVDIDGDGCARECPSSATPNCGGLLGSGCNADSFCDFSLDAACGATDQTGVCVTRPDVCTEQYSPVCGCDGRTYANDCAAHGAGVAVQHWGECAIPSCPPIAFLCAVGTLPIDSDGDGCLDGCQTISCPPYVPDCGGATPIDSNGDGCALECPAPTPVSCGGNTPGGPVTCPSGQFCDYQPGAICGFADAPGVCQPIPQACAQIYDPVCGCDGVTYGNACEAALHSVGVLSTGVCTPTCTPFTQACTVGTGPVDTDGDGCVDACRASCGGFAGLVCGSGELCYFPRSNACGAADQLGYCGVPPQTCTTLYDPVCGCDGKTYGNACGAAAAGISVQHIGTCAVVCPLYFPVCVPPQQAADTNGDGCIDGCAP